MKEDHQTMLLKRMRRPQKVPLFEALTRPWNRPGFRKGFNKELSLLEFLDFQSFESLDLEL